MVVSALAYLPPTPQNKEIPIANPLKVVLLSWLCVPNCPPRSGLQERHADGAKSMQRQVFAEVAVSTVPLGLVWSWVWGTRALSSAMSVKASSARMRSSMPSVPMHQCADFADQVLQVLMLAVAALTPGQCVHDAVGGALLHGLVARQGQPSGP